MLPLLLMLACTDAKVPGGGDEAAAALVVEAVGPAERIAGEAVEVGVQAVDAAGARVAEDLVATVSLGGITLGEVALVDGEGSAILALPTCAAGALSAEGAGLAGTGPELTVTPTVTLDPATSRAFAAGPLPDLHVAVTDVDGAPIRAGLDLTLSSSGEAGLVEEVDATAAEGVAVFAGGEAEGVGVAALVVAGDATCPLSVDLGEVVVGEDRALVPAFPPAVRVGEDAALALPAVPAVLGELPAGLSHADGWITGVAEESAATLVQGAVLDGTTAVALPVRLSVLPASDAELPDPDLDPSADGPHPVEVLDLVLPSIETSRGTFTDVALRVALPASGGPFPAVAFHHAAHSPPDIYDDYTVLHGHWASHGVVVASVDSQVNVSGQSQSWDNLTDMSSFQLATVDLLRESATDPTSPLHGRVDPDRIVVSGHSRGGGASLISLWRDPGLLGAVCFEQVSPLQTPGQDWGDPDRNGDRESPTRPILFFSGARDLDEAWPLVDVAYEQTTGPTAFVTIHGANHEDTYDAGTAGGKTSTSTIPRDARHAVDQHYATAFLYRFGGAGDAAGDLAWEAALFGPEGTSTDLSPEGVSVHGRRHLAASATIDAFQDPDGAGENLWGGENVGAELLDDANDEPYRDGLIAVGRYDERGTRIAGWARARHLSWTAEDAELAFFLDAAGPADLTAWDGLVLRLARDCPSPYRGSCPDVEVDLEVALWDADGTEVSVAVSEGLGDRGIVGRHWSRAQLPLDGFAGVDLSRVEGVALRLGAAGWVDGDLWVDDLRVE